MLEIVIHTLEWSFLRQENNNHQQKSLHVYFIMYPARGFIWLSLVKKKKKKTQLIDMFYANHKTGRHISISLTTVSLKDK